MRKFVIRKTSQALVLSRDRTKDVVSLLGLLMAVAACLSLCFLPVKGHPALPESERIPLLMLCFVFSGAYLWGLSLSLRRQVLVVDRARGQVFLNERPLLPISELQSVHLERESYGSNTQFILYLATKNKVKMELARDGVFGVSEPEMMSVAKALAEYIGINLVTPSSFVPGKNSSVMRFTKPKQQHGKQSRRSLLRRSKMRDVLTRERVRLGETRLAQECAKLDPAEEQALADGGLAAEAAQWPLYSGEEI